MASLRDRLREWWRDAYMVRGFGFLVPGFEHQRHRDRLDFYDRLQHYVVRVYPDSWWVAVYRGVPILGESRELVQRRVGLIMEWDRVPSRFEPAIIRVGTGSGGDCRVEVGVPRGLP
jgi:hypothetical protein